MNILFYTISHKRSRDIESQALAFSKKGHKIFLLTQNGRSELHEAFDRYGFTSSDYTYVSSSVPIFLFKHVVALLRFCQKEQIDLVYSHLDSCNLVAVTTQYFSRAQFVIYRHHAEALIYESNSNGRFLSKMIYRLAHTIIAVSCNAKNFMVEHEGIKASKIMVIPLSFDFSLYTHPAREQVTVIRDNYSCSLLMTTVGRLTGLKRMDKAIELAQSLTLKGIDVKLLVLGDGREEKYLKSFAKEKGIDNRVFFLGFTDDVLPYLKASDIYIHFSITEASCTTVKEAAIVSTPAIVCRGVGDFEEYIIDGVNSWVVDVDHCVEQSVEIFQSLHQDKARLSEAGAKLREDVIEHFDIANVAVLYDVFEKKG